MKKIFAALLALASSVAFGATLVPIQLLNPAGSTAGQMLVSSGASSAPAWSNAPTITGGTINNAVIGGTTPTGATFTNINSTGQVNFSNVSSGAAVVKMTGNGATTPNKYLGVLSGFFTVFSSDASTNIFQVSDAGNVSFPGALSFSQTAGIIGTTTNNNANAGSVGEYATNAQTGTALTSATPANITSVSLTAGDWDVMGTFTSVPNGTTTTQLLAAGISTTSATLPAANTGAETLTTAAAAAGVGQIIATPMVRISVASTTTVYLIAYAQFSVSTMNGSGFIRARRVR